MLGLFGDKQGGGGAVGSLIGIFWGSKNRVGGKKGYEKFG